MSTSTFTRHLRVVRHRDPGRAALQVAELLPGDPLAELDGYWHHVVSSTTNWLPGWAIGTLLSHTELVPVLAVTSTQPFTNQAPPPFFDNAAIKSAVGALGLLPLACAPDPDPDDLYDPDHPESTCAQVDSVAAVWEAATPGVVLDPSPRTFINTGPTTGLVPAALCTGPDEVEEPGCGGCERCSVPLEVTLSCGPAGSTLNSTAVWDPAAAPTVAPFVAPSNYLAAVTVGMAALANAAWDTVAAASTDAVTGEPLAGWTTHLNGDRVMDPRLGYSLKVFPPWPRAPGPPWAPHAPFLVSGPTSFRGHEYGHAGGRLSDAADAHFAATGCFTRTVGLTATAHRPVDRRGAVAVSGEAWFGFAKTVKVGPQAMFLRPDQTRRLAALAQLHTLPVEDAWDPCVLPGPFGAPTGPLLIAKHTEAGVVLATGPGATPVCLNIPAPALLEETLQSALDDNDTDKTYDKDATGKSTTTTESTTSDRVVQITSGPRGSHANHVVVQARSFIPTVDPIEFLVQVIQSHLKQLQWVMTALNAKGVLLKAPLGPTEPQPEFDG